jgi:tRNA-guanine transglycosylase
MRDLNCNLLLGNTYHLGNYPGVEVLEKYGGLHKFMSWDRNILTDSGGFQMVSLLKLAQITEEGVEFESPVDGSRMLLTPEESMRIQNAIGADIMMALDDVVSPDSTPERIEEACHRTLRWIDRCINAHAKKDTQNLFPIVQGGLDSQLRELCLDSLITKDLPGYAIGGLSGGEDKEHFWRVVAQCTSKLPADKPRYLMGVGYPVDLVVCACLGVDMFDCVFATRTARFGQALTRYGFLRLKNVDMKDDLRPIDSSCGCYTCQKHTRAYLWRIVTKEQAACHLITIHNLHYLLNLMLSLRDSIMEGTLVSFVNSFLKDWHGGYSNIPAWVFNAMSEAKIPIDAD